MDEKIQFFPYSKNSDPAQNVSQLPLSASYSVIQVDLRKINPRLLLGHTQSE